MNPEAFKFNVEIDEEYIRVIWTRLPFASELTAISRYPELQVQFKYRDISSDTVRAMLRDMEVPDSLSKAILTRITVNAN